jgi:Uma2 family endonuclease
VLWSEVLTNPYLKDLPFKIELNRAGMIEMSPASNVRGIVKGELAIELSKKRGGRAVMGCSIQTTNGVRVADVAWLTTAKYKAFGEETPYPTAPDICVEIMSPSNTWAEMHMKASLYLEAGAKEVWIQPIKGKRLVIKTEV